MSTNRACPFCGSSIIKIDTLNYTSGKPVKFRVQCQECHVSTGWSGSDGEAWEAWNRRIPAAAPAQEGINLLINKNIFILQSRVYTRIPETGNCTAQKEFRGKDLRIKEDVFLAAYRECKAACGKVKR